eukprot:598616-Hanusia_phi.AAC.1
MQHDIQVEHLLETEILVLFSPSFQCYLLTSLVLSSLVFVSSLPSRVMPCTLLPLPSSRARASRPLSLSLRVSSSDLFLPSSRGSTRIPLLRCPSLSPAPAAEVFNPPLPPRS